VAPAESAPVRGAWPVALLLLASVAAALWAAQPFRDLGQFAPQGGEEAAGAGLGAAAVLVAAIAAVGVLVVWLARKDARRAVRWFMLAAVAFGLLLGLVPVVLGLGGTAWAWAGAALAAGLAAWLLRGAGAPGWTAAALAAGGYAGMLAALAGLAVLAVLVAAVCIYDAWAVRRRRMAAVADAADRLGAPLQVGRATRRGGLSLGLGDLLLPAALVAAAADPSLGAGGLPALAGGVGLLAGLATLSMAVARGGDTPGTPFLCGGALAGIAAGLAAGLLGP
jgi:presenilin-like A22 family membrane protease